MHGRRAERAEAAEKSPALGGFVHQDGRFFGGFGSRAVAHCFTRERKERGPVALGATGPLE